MLQNKLFFNQSSVSLQIIGVPDYSSNENKNQISIITQWKLLIIDQPLIEGDIDHLRSIMNAFYSYSNFLIKDECEGFESKLIDIKAENFYTHNVILKSTKPNVKPLNLKIGNSVLADIVNCFDQFNASTDVRKIEYNFLKTIPSKGVKNIINKYKISNFFLPPLISLCSIFIMSSGFVIFYNIVEERDKNAFINCDKKIHSIKSISTII